MKVLVTGATGYVASRLTPALIEAGHEVRITSRDPLGVARRHPEVSAVASDLNEPSSLVEALEGIDVAYYLVHSMSGSDFERKDAEAAHNFLGAAEHAGVGRIVYLGGLGSDSDTLSHHLKSRQEVGRVLASGKIPVVEFRAAIIIGVGSAAFEMLRYLTERLPAMIAPRWLSTRTQPLAESDLVRYLLAAAEMDLRTSRVVQIGGSDVLTYRDMIQGYARARGLRRLIVSVPVLSPRLSSYWVNFVTPIRSSIAMPLIDGLRNEVVVTDESARGLFADIDPVGYYEALRLALASQIDFLDASTAPGLPPVPGSLEGFLVDEQVAPSEATPESLGEEINRIGGNGRWYPLRWTWWLRGRLDDLFGGAGLRWERPPGELRKGQRVDWWTVADVGPQRLLLRAEMKVPGEAWVEFRVMPAGGDLKGRSSELRQTAYFRPTGIVGRIYWWGLWPFHTAIFRLMARRIAGRAKTGGSGKKYTLRGALARVRH